MRTVLFILIILFLSGIAQIPELQKADSLFNAFQYEESLKFYEQAYNANPDNYEVIWKYCRALVDAGEMQKDDDVRKSYYLKASQIIDHAIELEPNKPEGYLYASIAYGRRALNAGAKERVKLSNKIRDAAEKAIELDPQNDIAYHVLARWHRKISNLSWIEKKFANIFLGGIPSDASMDKALEYFKKAIELNPNYINHYLELGITYKMLKKWDKAKEALKKAMELQAISPRDKMYQERAKELYDEIKDK